jgi:uncharacterized membrane protein YgdD (TMEM256/DUF423 family)
MQRWLGFVAALLGAIAVVLDALGAHLWRPHFTEIAVDSFQTGVRYLLIHAVLLFALARSDRALRSRLVRACALVILLGTLLFGLGLVLWTTQELVFARRCAPWGGSLLIFGWTGLALASLFDRRPLV